MKPALPLLLCCLAHVPGSLAASPDWTAQCSLAGQPFQVAFRSASGDAFEDDMQVSLLSKGTERMLAIPPALYHASGAASNAVGLCAPDGDGYSAALTAHRIDDRRVLLWLRKDGRPSFDTLSLALVDIGNGTLVDYLDTRREIKDSDGSQRLTIRQDADGFRVRLVDEWLQDTGTDSAENAIEAWLTVSVSAGKIHLGTAE